MPGDDLTTEREPESGAGARRPPPPEALEETVDVFARDPGTPIADLDRGRTPLRPHRELDRDIERCVSERIVDEVQDETLQEVARAAHGDRTVRPADERASLLLRDRLQRGRDLAY